MVHCTNWQSIHFQCALTPFHFASIHNLHWALTLFDLSIHTQFTLGIDAISFEYPHAIHIGHWCYFVRASTRNPHWALTLFRLSIHTQSTLEIDAISFHSMHNDTMPNNITLHVDTPSTSSHMYVVPFCCHCFTKQYMWHLHLMGVWTVSFRGRQFLNEAAQNVLTLLYCSHKLLEHLTCCNYH